MGTEDNRLKIDEARQRIREGIAGAEERRAGRLAEMVADAPTGEAMGVDEAIRRLRDDDAR
jgi:hypothetical protein